MIDAEQWQPIATARKDGSKMLGFFPEIGVQMMAWVARSSHWEIHGRFLPIFDPTHWMVLPDILPYPHDTVPRDGTVILAEFDTIGVVVAQWAALDGAAAQWNHGRWLPGAEPLRWDRLPSSPRT